MKKLRIFAVISAAVMALALCSCSAEELRFDGIREVTLRTPSLPHYEVCSLSNSEINNLIDSFLADFSADGDPKGYYAVRFKDKMADYEVSSLGDGESPILYIDVYDNVHEIVFGAAKNGTQLIIDETCYQIDGYVFEFQSALKELEERYM